jgi:hypothetical protein
MKYKGKKRKVKNPLIWANWKLREQLHAAKEEISDLETKKSHFYTFALFIKTKEGRVVLSYSNTYSNYQEALLIFNFFTNATGFYNCKIRIFIKNQDGIFLDQRIDNNFNLESEASNG